MSRSSRRDLVGLSLDRPLRQHQPGLGGVSRNQMQRARPIRRRLRAAQRLAVHGDDLARSSTRRRRPGGEASLQRLRVDEPEYFSESLRRGDSLGERQETTQPAHGPSRDLLNPLPIVRPANHPRQRRQQNLVLIVGCGPAGLILADWLAAFPDAAIQCNR
jgi:hypothetical protein